MYNKNGIGQTEKMETQNAMNVEDGCEGNKHKFVTRLAQPNIKLQPEKWHAWFVSTTKHDEINVSNLKMKHRDCSVPQTAFGKLSSQSGLSPRNDLKRCPKAEMID